MASCSNRLVSVEVLMDDGKSKLGLGEPTLKNLKPGAIIQFERMFHFKIVLLHLLIDFV